MSANGLAQARKLIREQFAAGVGDPDDVVAAVLPSLADSALQDIARGLLRVEVRRLLHEHRDATIHGSRAAGVSRWAALAKSADSGWWMVRGEWKALVDCTVEDVTWLADDYHRRASENAAREGWFRALARAMERHGATTVAALSESDRPTLEAAA